MALAILGPIIEVATKLIDKLIPDPSQKAEAKYKLLELAQKGELEALGQEVLLAKSQLEVNLAEASSPSLFKGGWRPAIGWIGAFALGYQFIAQPLLAWASGIYMYPAPPVLNLGDLITIIGGMLGLGTLRTYERLNGVIPKGK